MSSLVMSILKLDKGNPEIDTPLPPIISNLLGTSSLLSLCLGELLYFRMFVWPLLGETIGPLVRLRGDKNYPSSIFKSLSSSQGLLNLNGASFSPNTCFLHLFLLTVLTVNSILITLSQFHQSLELHWPL